MAADDTYRDERLLIADAEKLSRRARVQRKQRVRIATAIATIVLIAVLALIGSGRTHGSSDVDGISGRDATVDANVERPESVDPFVTKHSAQQHKNRALSHDDAPRAAVLLTPSDGSANVRASSSQEGGGDGDEGARDGHMHSEGIRMERSSEQADRVDRVGTVPAGVPLSDGAADEADSLGTSAARRATAAAASAPSSTGSRLKVAAMDAAFSNAGAPGALHPIVPMLGAILSPPVNRQARLLRYPRFNLTWTRGVQVPHSSSWEPTYAQRARLPERDLKERYYRSCAVVGSSGTLRRSGTF